MQDNLLGNDRLESLKRLLMELSDLCGRLEWFTREFIFKDPQYVNYNLNIADRMNRLTSTGRLSHAELPTVMLKMAMDDGYYPVQIDKSRKMFIKHNQMADLRDRVKTALERQEAEKVRIANLKNNEKN